MGVWPDLVRAGGTGDGDLSAVTPGDLSSSEHDFHSYSSSRVAETTHKYHTRDGPLSRAGQCQDIISPQGPPCPDHGCATAVVQQVPHLISCHRVVLQRVGTGAPRPEHLPLPHQRRQSPSHPAGVVSPLHARDRSSVPLPERINNGKQMCASDWLAPSSISLDLMLLLRDNSTHLRPKTRVHASQQRAPVIVQII